MMCKCGNGRWVEITVNGELVVKSDIEWIYEAHNNFYLCIIIPCLYSNAVGHVLTISVYSEMVEIMPATLRVKMTME